MSEYEPSYLKLDYVKWTDLMDSIAAENLIKARAEKEKSVSDRVAKSPNLTCFIDQFPLAMAAIANVHDYARGPLVKGDYRPSMLRHLFKIGEHPDHDAAAVWNAMAQLEIKLREARRVSPDNNQPCPPDAAYSQMARTDLTPVTAPVNWWRNP